MNARTIPRVFGKAGTGFAAIAMAAVLATMPASAQAQSVAAVPENEALPDPQTAKGLEIFSNHGEKIGTIEDVVEQNGQRMAVVAIEEWAIDPAQRVVVPYRNLQVANGTIIYDVSGAAPGDPLRRDPGDAVEWESLEEQSDVDDNED